MKKSRIANFIKVFVKKPLDVGSITPSSRFLAAAILKNLDFSKLKVVVEYGPGTGVFTQFLLSSSSPSKTQVRVIEFNADFVSHLNERFPANQYNIVIKQDRAANVKNILKTPDELVDVVISSLPFTFFPWEETLATINASYEVLADGGVFRTYLYLHTLPLPKIQRLLSHLKVLFGNLNSWVVLANIPPAIVVECIKSPGKMRAH